ncbi:glycosyltransferase family 2 protein [Paenibacillus sp. MSJ-34]|uniref:glycosyltransferase family 2 protein n=1 Tax=Paenibacillus sp. MSJ-34 TaxID=2841529 RepID=UPI001C114A46|nr:glycosyltransferase family 2 protein [Paenibacillus sp. MSJ-34]MBU5444367.1 glycosyltransferase family 2 protein [Paenibacillus sp. MSJ-34]
MTVYASNYDNLLSIIVPAYNEESVLEAFHKRLISVLDGIEMKSEIIYVNDGSRDRTLEILNSIRQCDHRVAIVDLSRNFGKEIAMAAGLDYANGDAVVIIDADLQDPPELIPELIKEWGNGFDVVYAKRTLRQGETFFKRTTAFLFYRFIQRVSNVSIPEDTGDFRLLSRKAVESLRKLREQQRFSKGLFAWIGFPQKEVLYQRDPRYAGVTKWNYIRLWNLAIEGITSFTIAPLKIASYMGGIFALISFLFILVIIFQTLVFGNPVKGYPSLIVVVLFIGGIQLICLGIIGEYLGRIFNETKKRPLYLLNNYYPSENSSQILASDRFIVQERIVNGSR